MLLALETVASNCSVCLYDHEVVALATEHAPRKQTQRILPMIDALFAQAGVALADVQVIAFNRGPGSFSGIRINTAVAQALAFVHDTPCVPVSGLQAQAQAIFEENQQLSQVCIINDAKMQEVYAAQFYQENGMACLLGDEQLLPYTDDFTAKKIPHVYGDGVPLVSLPENCEQITTVSMTAKHIATLGWQAWLAEKAVPATEAQPVYLRHKAWKTLAEQKSRVNVTVTQ